MNLYRKIRQFISLKLRGVSFRSAAQCFKMPLTDDDYYILIMLACVCAILVVLSFADYIDGIQRHADNMRMASEYNQEVALHHERTIVSMLNGEFVMNGRRMTVCIYDAAGECR